MTRSQRHKIEEQGYTSGGDIYDEGAINDKVLGAVGAVANARPVLTSINPATAVCGSADLTMHALGSAFDVNTKIIFGGATMATTFVSATDISCIVKPSQNPLPKLSTVQVVKAGLLSSADTKSFSFTATAGLAARSADDERNRGPFSLLRIEPDDDGGAWYVFERMDIEEGDTLRAEATGNSSTNGDFEALDISNDVEGETAVYWKDAALPSEVVGKGRITIL